MEKLKNKVLTISDRISKFITNSCKTGKEKRNETFLKARLQLLQNYWDQFCQGYEELCDIANEEQVKEDEFFTSDTYSEVECVYVEAVSWLQEQLTTFQTSREDAGVDGSRLLHSTVHSAPPLQTIKLPKINLPIFCGSYLDWPSFYDTYVSLIHNNSSLSNVQKMHYLKSAVTGEASKLLNHFAITNANYESAWNIILARYDNKRVLVNANLHELITLPCMASESPNELKRVLDRFNQGVRALENLSRPVQEWNDWLVYFLTGKLDNSTRKDWETSLSSSKEVPAFESLQKFLETRLQALNALRENCAPVNISSMRKSRNSPRSKSYSQAHHTSRTPECSCCQGQHFILFCPKFRAKSVEERTAFIKSHRICTNCLKSNHDVTTCPSINRCKQCNQQHHTMIHPSTVNATQSSTAKHLHGTIASSSKAPEPINCISTRSHVSNQHCGHSSVLLATAVVLVQGSDGRLFRARALLDQGSESSFITAALANTLRLRKQRTNVSVLGVGQCKAGTVQAVVNHNIISCIDSSKKYCVRSLVLPTLTHRLPSKIVYRQDWAHIAGLPLADPEFDKPSGIDMILGAEVYSLILKGDIRHGSKGAPIAQDTTLGWILSGRVHNASSQTKSILSLHTTSSDINTLLQKFWETEEPPRAPIHTPEEAECEAFFANTHFRNNQGRYVVKLPFKSNHALLGNSRDAAMVALIRMERRFKQDSALLAAYSDFMNEYLSLGHMELVPNEAELNSQGYYLPHHAVFKPTSTTTKLRVVFNASQITTTGYSLNDILHIGPKLQNDVILVLTRWRFFRYAFCADIAKMFRQIMVDRSDADFQRILWRNSLNESVKCFRLLTVTYGTACAPYLACKTLQQLANDYKSQYPTASKILQENFYVDDALFGASTRQEAKEVRSELDTLLLQGGFKLRKWLSNSAELLDEIPLDDRELTTSVKLVSDSQIKTLGVGWNPDLDSFVFQFQLSQSTVSTKRSVLSDISRLYDPCGWLSPVTITAKIFLQTLWKQKLDWDEDLPSNLTTEWLHYKKELRHINNVKIPRWIGINSCKPIMELHGFCDASQSAYGAAVYIRIKHDDSNSQVRLLTSKTRVSRVVSIPRLELCGAALLAELIPYLQHNLNLQDVPVHTWTDSTIVLAWLRAHPSKWKVYVANRVAQIQEKIPNAMWHHIPSEDNPADCITRGIPASELQNYKLWWQGPSWLSLSCDFWPQNELPPSSTEIEEELRNSCSSTTTFATLTIDQDDFVSCLLHQFSDIMRLLRVTAYIYRFFNNCKSQSNLRSGFLKTEEIDKALELWIKLVQHRAFHFEIKTLLKSTLPSNNKLRKLNPKLDNKSLLRVGGRLKHALLSEDEKFPLILPTDNHLTKLIIAHSHTKTLHGGTQATLQHIRSKYWIINGRNKVKQFIRQCVICCRFQAVSRIPLMGDLPIDRVRPAKPFLHCGVDYAGPFIIKLIKGRCRTKLKTYVACFVCFATRAIHLELVMDLTTDAFIAAFRRFISRRGRCARIYSDNGRTFVAADKQLSQHLRQIMSEGVIPQATLKDGTEWHFIPPYSPHFGGLWEAGVKAMKHHFKRVVGNHLLSLEEMLTLLAQIEACLNSRPLQAISDDPSDISALTPGHFLVGESLLAMPEPSILDTSFKHLSRWQMIQHMNESIWKRWYKEYLTHLQLRYKWQNPSEPLQLNALVLIKDDNLPPQRWLLGRVVDLHPGLDGEIRVVTIRHKEGYFKRPVTKLCVLPVEPQD